MWIIILSFCNFISLIMALAFCLCWKKKNPKNDLLGLDGMVTQKNPDENVNHLPSAAPQCYSEGVPLAINVDSVDLSKRQSFVWQKFAHAAMHVLRNTVVNNPRRSLPDIPFESGERQTAANVSWEPTGDNSSDLYASVEQYQSNVKRSTVPNGVEVRPSLSQHSSISQGDGSFSPYARVNYEKEHPYARLQNIVTNQLEENSEEEASVRLLRVENGSPEQLGEPSAPPRSRRASSHSGGHIDIPAATAVAGGIAASQELPYMTPPVAQTNFSGDSQDSSKGYTSISVREPLANIIAQMKEMNKLKRDLDPHYATVSDDSDDVYTTIPDPNIPSSGSETYARISGHTIAVEAVINTAPSADEEDLDDALYEPAPQPLRKVASHTHSRQASSSSSVANIGSPKPEKRPANSPLPPPPSISPDLPVMHTVKNLDDMYAKVHKTKKKNTSQDVDADSTLNSTSSSSSSMDDKKDPPQLSISEIDGKPLRREHNYETLKKSPRKCSDPGYEKIRQDKADCGSEPGYASINGPDSILSTDPGYEVLKQKTCSETDPNYEKLRHRPSNASDSDGYTRINDVNRNNEKLLDGYSVVKKPQNNNSKSGTSSSYESTDARDFSFDEPNYESMPSESEPNYAALKSTDSESDPNYESVGQNDPNYESVKYLNVGLTDPPYERLSDDSSKTDSDVPGYEKIKLKKTDSAGYETIDRSKGRALIDPPYEQLNNEQSNSATDNRNVNNVPDYETIKNNNTNLGDSDDDGIIQV